MEPIGDIATGEEQIAGRSTSAGGLIQVSRGTGPCPCFLNKR